MFDNKDKRIRGSKGVAIRAAFLARHPLCVKCEEHGLTVLAEEVDHIVPLHASGEDKDANKQGLCKVCHALKTASEHVGSLASRAFPEWLEPATCQLTIVFGPPGSGKSTYVRENAKSGDITVDLDEIKAGISQLPLYAAGDEWLSAAIRERNRILGSLKREIRPTWFIASGAGKADRDWWVDKLHPSAVVVLDVPESECIARIRMDQRRPNGLKSVHVAAVRAWWASHRGQRVSSARRVAVGADGYPLD